MRGFRVEPGEIEAVLACHPRVREAAVVVRTADGDRRLIAYVTVMDAAGDDAALKSFLQARLPDYMVPSAIVPLDAMPLTTSGKIDRAALPEPGRVRSGGEPLPPRTPDEAMVARIWSEVLGREAVGVSDNFLELGGHSLLATQVVARLLDEIGVDLPLRTMFTAPTVESLAAELGRVRAAGAGATPASPIQPVSRSAVRSGRVRSAPGS